jgi:diguanylate cyclase (GGDEF)-like protein
MGAPALAEESRVVAQVHGARSPGDPATVGLREAIRRKMMDASYSRAVDGVGCLLLDDECALRYAAASNTAAESLEVAEEVCVEGPCHESFAGEDVTYGDVQAEHRWERLTALLATSPIRTVIGVPILLDGQSIGALDAYSALPQAWEQADFDDLHRAAAAVTRLIERALDDRLDDRGDELTAQLRAAVVNRDRVRRAADVVMASTGLNRPTALLRLRQLAAASDQSTVTVADQVVANDGLPSASLLASQAEAIREARQETARLAITDPLTGVANRALFLDHVAQALGRAERSGRHPAIVFLDLDRFKTLNDSLGHAAGDDVLRTVATRLEAQVRAQDTVARLGGDEFAVLYDAPSRPEVVEQLATRLAAAVARPIELSSLAGAATPRQAHQVTVHASLGVAIADSQEPREPAELLRDADMAMYDAKTSGGNRMRRFSDRVRDTGHRVMNIELTLRSLLVGGQHASSEDGEAAPDGLRLVYQPIVALDTGRIDSLEALVRWDHPRLGAVGAQELITAAENAGLIAPLGDALLRDACTAAARWLSGPKTDDLVIAVNVSPLQLAEAHFVESVARALDLAGLDASHLCLELTESQTLAAGGVTLDTLHGLHELGVRLTIDDFGTGYSSLSYLAELPLTRLKLDRAFVAGLTAGSRGDAVARAVIGLGRSLDLQTVAEGIETDEQARYVTALDCQLAQGYLYSRPVEVAQVPELLRTGPLPTAGAPADGSHRDPT